MPLSEVHPMTEPTIKPQSLQHESAPLHATLQRYFVGLYTGDANLLSEVFHPSARLSGVVADESGRRLRAEVWSRGLGEYLPVVAGRASPKTLGEEFEFEVLSIDRDGPIATAKVRCPMLGKVYIDHLALVLEGGAWRIIHKMYVQVLAE